MYIYHATFLIVFNNNYIYLIKLNLLKNKKEKVITCLPIKA